jgi:hypothetical protein
MPEKSPTEGEALSRLRAIRNRFVGVLPQGAIAAGAIILTHRLFHLNYLTSAGFVSTSATLGILPKRLEEMGATVEKIGKRVTGARYGVSNRLYRFRVCVAASRYDRRLNKHGPDAQLSRTQQYLVRKANPDASVEDLVARFDPRWTTDFLTTSPQGQYNVLLNNWWNKHLAIVSHMEQALTVERDDLERYIKVPKRLLQLYCEIERARARRNNAIRYRDEFAGPSEISKKVEDANQAVSKTEAYLKGCKDELSTYLKGCKDELSTLRSDCFGAPEFPETPKLAKLYFVNRIRSGEVKLFAEALAASCKALEDWTTPLITSPGSKIGLDLQKALLAAVKEADAWQKKHYKSKDRVHRRSQLPVEHLEARRSRQPPLETQYTPTGNRNIEIAVVEKMRALVSWAGLSHETREAIQNGVRLDARELTKELLALGEFVSDYYEECRNMWLQKLGFENRPLAEWRATVDLLRVHCPPARLIRPNQSRDGGSTLLPSSPHHGIHRRRR